MSAIFDDQVESNLGPRIYWINATEDCFFRVLLHNNLRVSCRVMAKFYLAGYREYHFHFTWFCAISYFTTFFVFFLDLCTDQNGVGAVGPNSLYKKQCIFLRQVLPLFLSWNFFVLAALLPLHAASRRHLPVACMPAHPPRPAPP